MSNKPKECGRCAWCCENLSFIYQLAPDIIQWLQARGFQYIQKSETHVEAAIYAPCPFLRIEDNLGTCLCHDTKPDICRKSPSTRNKAYIKVYASKGLDVNKSLGPDCGYREKE